MFRWFHRLGSPRVFYPLAGTLARWFAWIGLALGLAGLYFALLASPQDYQQGESVRIMYVHVPAAWMSMFVYMVMASASAVVLIWRIKLAAMVAIACAPIGAWFTFLALATGALWGKPMWGAWWVWDARLTSELILLFLYLGFIALHSAIEDRDSAARAAGVLALVGVVNIPIIHFSVKWWNTLHQGPTVTRLDTPAIHYSMLIPLLLMAFAFMFYFGSVMLRRVRCELLEREGTSPWVRDLLGDKHG